MEKSVEFFFVVQYRRRKNKAFGILNIFKYFTKMKKAKQTGYSINKLINEDGYSIKSVNKISHKTYLEF